MHGHRSNRTHCSISSRAPASAGYRRDARRPLLDGGLSWSASPRHPQRHRSEPRSPLASRTSGPVYVRRVEDDAEFSIPSRADVVSLGELEARTPRVAARGAAYDAYGLVFSLPFDREAVASYAEPAGAWASEPLAGAPDRAPPMARGGSVSGGPPWDSGSQVWALASVSRSRRRRWPAGVAARRAGGRRERNDAISTRNTASALSLRRRRGYRRRRLLLLLWPPAPHLRPRVSSSASPSDSRVRIDSSKRP